jgi:competence ComEA-like helix-hairpin-helix protein
MSWKIFALTLAAAGCAAAQTAEQDAKTLPESTGREVTAKVCLDCHEASRFRKVRLDRGAWEHEVALMVDNGAKATDDEVEAIVAYLVENFGPQSKIWVNTAPVEEFKAVLGITAKQAVAIVEYRQANGPFKSQADLLKVPEIDAKKIEDHKDLLAF